MENISQRIAHILEEMEGPDRGKQVRLAEIAKCTKGLINQLLTNPAQKLGYEYAKNIEDRLGYRADWIIKGTLPEKIAPLAKNDAPQNIELIDIAYIAKVFSKSHAKTRMAIVNFVRDIEAKNSASLDADSGDMLQSHYNASDARGKKQILSLAARIAQASTLAEKAQKPSPKDRKKD